MALGGEFSLAGTTGGNIRGVSTIATGDCGQPLLVMLPFSKGHLSLLSGTQSLSESFSTTLFSFDKGQPILLLGPGTSGHLSK